MNIKGWVVVVIHRWVELSRRRKGGRSRTGAAAKRTDFNLAKRNGLQA